MERFIIFSDKNHPEIAKRVLEEGKRIIALQEARKAAKQNAWKEAKANKASKTKKDLTAYFTRLTAEIAMLEKE